jgi:hypothetical protein
MGNKGGNLPKFLLFSMQRLEFYDASEAFQKT